jgi:hypothetical protein
MATVFTRILAGELPGTFVHRDDLCAVLLSINPLAPGHALVIPVDLPPPLRRVVPLLMTLWITAMVAFRGPVVAMLRQMTSAKTLNLFNDEPEELVETRVGDKPAPEEPKVVAQSDPTENTFNPEPTTHDHADLRLQPDPTPGPEGAKPKPV